MGGGRCPSLILEHVNQSEKENKKGLEEEKTKNEMLSCLVGEEGRDGEGWKME